MAPKQSPEEVAEAVLAEHQYVLFGDNILRCACGAHSLPSSRGQMSTREHMAMHQVDRLKDAGLMIGHSTEADPATAEQVTFVQEVKPGENWELTMTKDEPANSEGYVAWGEQAQEGVLNFLRSMAGAPTDPDCIQGKHKACGGTAWDTEKDEPTLCSCSCHKKE